MTSRFALALLLAGMSPAAAAPRQAAPPDRFDGTWSVEIITETGSCDRAYRYPVRIENGRARFIGTAFVVEGGVTRNGAIRGSISNGAATADVRGRLDRNGFGAGTWVASGALSCRGHWNAERRG
ncbi:large exoprotein involved in heme utilization or adhesion [Methylobacterium sp. XJLW]|uniref:Protein of unassigned function n=1 Tax=Methylobacterium oryzae CBMB20 TaxID=693986 RepID=A0A089Q9K7_9HYPH|nr:MULTISPECIES: hypothetical protein [Methylobacterium]AIQ91274.1 protein of unassigned function [Methylobacterium oryzae CBMB20]AWV16866.1 large exoprotein involved in heme utilization or adhesion [Methylobacterium sp. XJLW]